MRVICIDDKLVRLPRNNNKPAPIFLGEYIVTATKGFNELVEPGFRAEGLYYKLVEFSNMWYHAKMFAILPDKSADEMSQESKEAIINIEHSIL